ncbi:MAG: 50S ribosomal protein L21 [Lentisphaerae bacterium]|nr:50S ribosomal protein L21 [Lentisphaerota bacterium]
MEAYAVIETGGKQYRVKTNDTLCVERLERPVGEKVNMDRVLAVSDGTSLKVGTPEVSGAKVTSTVLEHVLADKVVSFKKRRRKGYHRKQGHRQEQTLLRVDSIA